MTPGSRSQATPGRRDTEAQPGVELQTLPTAELGARLTAELVALCGRAFREPFERPWRAVGPGTHVVAMLEGHAVGHALLIERVVAVGLEQPIGLHTAYVENVAAEPRLQGRGIGSAVMRAVNMLVDRYELGALATASNRFYERLGWLTWRGPVYVRREGRLERLSGEDGRVMVRTTPRGPATLDLDAPISVEGRAWNAW